MIEAFQYINKAFESKVRLGIMAILMVNEEADFQFSERAALSDRRQSCQPYPCPGRTGIYRM
jgi:transcriptional regulator